jgi:hypothetical protein
MLFAQNIESELSYAYLHAIASRGGIICEVAGRHSDEAGVDAVGGRPEDADDAILETGGARLCRMKLSPKKSCN